MATVVPANSRDSAPPLPSEETRVATVVRATARNPAFTSAAAIRLPGRTAKLEVMTVTT